MSNITRYNSSALDDLFQGFLMRPMMLDDRDTMQIRMDVSEDDKSYTVHAEMPGVKKDDIQVNIDGNRVTISAEAKDEKEVKDGDRLLRSERYYGTVSRSFTLAEQVDEAGALARYTDGVLQLTLPKRVAGSSKKLVIQ